MYKNIKKISYVFLLSGLISFSSLVLFAESKVAAQTMTPPLTPGCYTRLSENQSLYTDVNCPDEGRARAVSQFGACYVGLDERDCENPNLSGSNTPTPGSFSGERDTEGDGAGRTELSQGQCDEGLNREDCGIVDIIVTVINFMSALAGIAIVGSIMYAGYQYMTARDNAGQIQQARQRIIWALSALFIFIFMYAFLNFLVPGGIL